MEHQRIRVGDLVFDREQMDESVVQNKLLTFRNTHTRALCLCRSEGVEMYVGLRGGMCYLARLPGSTSRLVLPLMWWMMAMKTVRFVILTSRYNVFCLRLI